MTKVLVSIDDYVKDICQVAAEKDIDFRLHQGQTRYKVNVCRYAVTVRAPWSTRQCPLFIYFADLNYAYHGKHEIRCSDSELRDLIYQIHEAVSDLARYAKKYGDVRRHCCFCGEGLSTVESVRRGYGPVCAKRQKLPWGD